MPMERLSVSRCLEVLQLPLARRQKFIERHARDAVAKELFGPNGDGQDFYGCFWADAKLSAVNDDFDLTEATKERIIANMARRNLYPKLLDGFGKGWSRLVEAKAISGPLKLISGLLVKIKGDSEEDLLKIENLLAVEERSGRVHIIYPYFSKTTALGLRHARIGLGVMQDGFDRAKPDTIAIFDVLRGNLYMNDDVSIDGTERAYLLERYDAMMREWRVQKRLIRK